jgi:predicted RNA-binding Zn-ribbon protein involved in translation (DUF1610 family)
MIKLLVNEKLERVPGWVSMGETEKMWCWNCEQYVDAVKVSVGWECPRCHAMIG